MIRLLERSLAKFEVDPDDVTTVAAGYQELQSKVVSYSRNNTDEGADPGSSGTIGPIRKHGSRTQSA